MMNHIPKNDFSLASLTMLTAILFSSCGMPTTQILPVATGDTPPAGKCLIIVERESTSIGAWVNNEVYDNGTHVGTLTSGGKLAWLRDPGPMNLRFGGPGPYKSPYHTKPTPAGESDIGGRTDLVMKVCIEDGPYRHLMFFSGKYDYNKNYDKAADPFSGTIQKFGKEVIVDGKATNIENGNLTIEGVNYIRPMPSSVLVSSGAPYYSGRQLSVLSGKKYCFKINLSISTGFTMDGPGTPLISNPNPSIDIPASAWSKIKWAPTMGRFRTGLSF